MFFILKKPICLKIICSFLLFFIPHVKTICLADYMCSKDNVLANETTKVKIYAQKLIKDGYQLFDKKNNINLRQNAEKLTGDNLNLIWMAKYSLGRYRRSITKEEFIKYFNVYSKYLIKAYSSLVKDYNGQKAYIKRIYQIKQNRYKVNTVLKDGITGDDIEIIYLIDNTKNGYKISDISTSGVSLLNSQKNEFGNILIRKNIDGLISELKAKIKQ